MEMIIFIVLPASGKSTYYKNNLDILKILTENDFRVVLADTPNNSGSVSVWVR